MCHDIITLMCRNSGGNNLVVKRMLTKKKRKQSTFTRAKLASSRLVTFSYPWSQRAGDLQANLRLFSVRLYVAPLDEIYMVSDCHQDLTMKTLKCRLEILAGIPVNFQRLQYLDEMDLDDNSTFKSNDIIPGGTITMKIWHEDAWERLVIAAAKGNTKKLRSLGATKTSLFRTAHASLLSPEEESNWLAHRAFVALFVTVARNDGVAAKFLLENGADVRYKSPLGRTVLHIAAARGKLDCLDLLLKYGSKVTEEDFEGYTPMTIARFWGQKESERRLYRYQWQMRVSAGSRRPSSKAQP
ncbi:hypothetical protein lerEdw1_002068 [Lerista edwardsae]|nr:hypothetical protein lerEdw1_002068 [Lerista edwardsae]